MIYSIVLTYTRPMSEVNLHLDSHKNWLIENVRQGRVIFAGPLESKTGGLILAACADQEEVAAMMAEDSFITQQVAGYHVYACNPGLASADFQTRWAPDAKFI